MNETVETSVSGTRQTQRHENKFIIAEAGLVPSLFGILACAEQRGIVAAGSEGRELLLKARPAVPCNTAWTYLHEAAIHSDAFDAVQVLLHAAQEVLTSPRLRAYVSESENPDRMYPLHWWVVTLRPQCRPCYCHHPDLAPCIASTLVSPHGRADHCRIHRYTLTHCTAFVGIRTVVMCLVHSGSCF